MVTRYAKKWESGLFQLMKIQGLNRRHRRDGMMALGGVTMGMYGHQHTI